MRCRALCYSCRWGTAALRASRGLTPRVARGPPPRAPSLGGPPPLLAPPRGPWPRPATAVGATGERSSGLTAPSDFLSAAALFSTNFFNFFGAHPYGPLPTAAAVGLPPQKNKKKIYRKSYAPKIYLVAYGPEAQGGPKIKHRAIIKIHLRLDIHGPLVGAVCPLPRGVPRVFFMGCCALAQAGDPVFGA